MLHHEDFSFIFLWAIFTYINSSQPTIACSKYKNNETKNNVKKRFSRKQFNIFPGVIIGVCTSWFWILETGTFDLY